MLAIDVGVEEFKPLLRMASEVVLQAIIYFMKIQSPNNSFKKIRPHTWILNGVP